MTSKAEELGTGHAHTARQCTLADLATVKDGHVLPDDFLAGANAYLACFAAPIFGEERNGTKNLVCLHCGEELTGFLAGLLGRGGFEWGLAHGEGHCGGCGWPARALHYAKDAEGKDLFTLKMVLQYLPDFVTKRRAECETA